MQKGSEAARGKDLAAILRHYLREVLARDLSPAGPEHGGVPRAQWPAEWIADALAETKAQLARRDAHRVDHEVDRLIRAHGLPEEMRGALGIGILEAEMRAYEEMLRRARGDRPLFLPDEPASACPGAQQNAGVAPAPHPQPPLLASPATAPLASALVEPFFERRSTVDKTKRQVMGQERGTVVRFLEVAGDRPVSAYGRGDVTRFLDTLRRLPKTYGRAPKDRGRALAEIIADADAKKAARLTDKTVKRHLTALAQLFRFAMDRGHITNGQRVELVEGHRFREERSARAQRDAWTSEELSKLFSSPVWTGRQRHQVTKPGPHIIRDAKFWLPILALFHGARLEEFADLYRRDVGCDDGTWFFNIAEQEEDVASGKRARSLKTDNATRVVPIHPEVIRLGFLEYVSRTASQDDDPLFPDLPPQGADQRRGPRFTRDFRYYREQVGVYRPGVGMHAFRHLAITRLTDAITTFKQRRHRDYLMGHGGSGSEGDVRYDKGPGLKEVAATLALLTFPEVDLSRLHLKSDAPRQVGADAESADVPQDTP